MKNRSTATALCILLSTTALLLNGTPAQSQAHWRLNNIKTNSSIFRTSTPSLSGGVSTRRTQFGELEELNAYSRQYRKRLDITTPTTEKHWNSVPFRHKLWLYTIDKDKFLGNCSVARLGTVGDKYSYYLVLMHFNIPAVKSTFIPLKYGFARFEAKIACHDNNGAPTGFSESDALGLTESAEILSVYPQNAVLPVNRTDTTDVTLTAQPSWMGASGGSAQYERKIEDTYPYTLPHVVGIGTRFGDASWTFYPAKAQPIMLGEQSTFAIIKVPADTSSIRILANLRYQLRALKYATFFPFRVCDFCDLDLLDAPSFDELAAVQYFGLPEGVRDKLVEAFGAPGEPEHELKFCENSVTGKSFLVDQKTGKAYALVQDPCTKAWRRQEIP